MMADILAFSGSCRSGSFSKMLLAAAIKESRLQGASVREIDLRAFDLPIYDGDLERSQGLPRGAFELREIVKAHRTILIASTDYNGGVVPLLKNALDWVSRPHEDEANLSAIEGKTVALISCSLGMFGGQRAQAHLRQSFQVMRCLVIPDTVCVAFADQAFDVHGRLKSDAARQMLSRAIRELIRVSSALLAFDSRTKVFASHDDVVR